MKKIALIFIFILLLNNIYPDSKQSQNAKLTIVVEGIKKMEGQISIGIYNSKDGWAETNKQYKGVYIKVTSNTISYTFKEFPKDTYAVAIFHDLNMNKIHDKNLFGVPKEGYAFSNNVFGALGPPDFLKASFVFDKDLTKRIKLKN